MNDWRETVGFIVLWVLLMSCLVWLAGCTATSLQQREAAAAAFDGTYINGIGCTRLQTATGTAAVAAASESQARQVETRTPERRR